MVRATLKHRAAGLVLALAAATLAPALPCPAQVRLEVTPFVGTYLPVGRWSSTRCSSLRAPIRTT